MDDSKYDAIVIGAGPNGLAAAIRLAERGKKVCVLEAEAQIGGAARSGQLTIPGFIHDYGSAIHPLAISSPFLKRLPLAEHGLRWIHSPLAVAHPLDDGTAVVLAPSIDETVAGLGVDGNRYRAIFSYFAENADGLFSDILAPLKFPKHPILMSRFGMLAVLSARGFVDREFKGERARLFRRTGRTFVSEVQHSRLGCDRAGARACSSCSRLAFSRGRRRPHQSGDG